ncbi:histidine kinase [Lewinella sp. LCG006]|uniref:histidine kinase n=1 Tax=Lewinella sp. LCG006 TaxID=3231911 RepID=UPI00345FE30D
MLKTLFSSKPFLGILLLLLLYSCGQYRGGDFEPQRLRQLTEKELKAYADTSTVLHRIMAMESPSQQVDSLLHFAEWVKNYDEEATLFYAQLAYDISTENNWNIQRGISANRLAWSKGKRAQFGEDIEDAMVDALISKRLLANQEGSYWEADINNLLGYLYIRQGEQDSARVYLLKALEMVDQLALDPALVKKNHAMILNNLAITCSWADSLQEAAYYQQSDSLFQELGNWENRTRLWLDWGVFYTHLGQYAKADTLLSFCVDYGERNNDLRLLVKAYQKKAYLYIKKFAKDQSTEYFNQARNLLQKSLTLPDDNTYRSYDLLGTLFQHSWYSLDIENHADSSIHYFSLAMERAQREGAIGVMNNICANISTMYDYGDGIHHAALKESYSEFVNKHYQGVVDTLTANAKAAYQRINKVEQRDLTIQENIKQRNQRNIGLAILLLVGILFILFLQRLQNRRLRAEMSAFRAQINPHFISNSLNAIEHLVNQGERRQASKYLVHFSRLTRQILNSAVDSIVSLEQELKTLKHFLMLEQLRFSDKLSFSIECEETLDKSTIAIPAMILQPYVENAIWHGIKPKEEGGTISILITKEQNVLVCIIEDNGIGREAAQLRKVNAHLQQKSRGMDITRQRLKALGSVKGPALQIEDKKDHQGHACGTKITLRLPLKSI